MIITVVSWWLEGHGGQRPVRGHAQSFIITHKVHKLKLKGVMVAKPHSGLF